MRGPGLAAGAPVKRSLRSLHGGSRDVCHFRWQKVCNFRWPLTLTTGEADFRADTAGLSCQEKCERGDSNPHGE